MAHKPEPRLEAPAQCDLQNLSCRPHTHNPHSIPSPTSPQKKEIWGELGFQYISKRLNKVFGLFRGARESMEASLGHGALRGRYMDGNLQPGTLISPAILSVVLHWSLLLGDCDT